MTGPGLILIVVCVVVIVLAVMSDKKASAKFEADMKEKYPVKDSFKQLYVTENGELLLDLPSGSLKGYKKWNLNEVGYVATYDNNQFSICNRDMKETEGEYLTPSKKKFLKEKAFKTFPIAMGTETKDYVEFIKKHAGHVQHVVGGKVVD